MSGLTQVKVFVDDCSGAASMITGHCACLGIPVVGNSETDRQIHCFPELACPPKSINCMKTKILKLLDEPLFYGRMVAEGLENVKKNYSFDVCKKRLMRYLNE